MTIENLAAHRLAGRPWAIAPARLEGLLAVATALMPEPRGASWSRESVGPRGYGVTDSGVAVLPVLGPLVARGDWLTALLGATEYGAIAEALTTASADPGVRAILLELDSPGGEVSGLFDLVEEVAAIRARSGKPLWAVASDAALSAAYAIASAADRLWVGRTGEVGSVGVVAVHVDASAADAIAGLKWTLIHAGARKTDGNPHEPLSPRATADLQADVDALYGDLVTLVARNRKLDEAAVRAGDAAIYRGARALPTGLADAVGSPAQALAALVSTLDTRRPPAGRRSARSFSTPARTTARTTAMSSPEVEPPSNWWTPLLRSRKGLEGV